MKTANEMRVDLAGKQRMQKTRDKWLEQAIKINKIYFWSKKTELPDGLKIGDRVGFVVTKPCRGGFTCSQKYGVAFAFGEHSMLIMYRGKIEKVKLPDIAEDIRDVI